MMSTDFRQVDFLKAFVSVTDKGGAVASAFVTRT